MQTGHIVLYLAFFSFLISPCGCVEEGDSIESDFPEFQNLYDDARISEKFKQVIGNLLESAGQGSGEVIETPVETQSVSEESEEVSKVFGQVPADVLLENLLEDPSVQVDADVKVSETTLQANPVVKEEKEDNDDLTDSM